MRAGADAVRWLASLALVGLVIAGCTTDARSERPTIDMPARLLHVCFESEPTNEGPCTDQALQTCPSDQGRQECLNTALDQIAAVDAFTPVPAEGGDGGGLPPFASTGIALATIGSLSFLGWGIGRRTRARNSAAFDEQLGVLRARGFSPTDREVPLPLAAHRVARRVRRVRRVLVRGGALPVWLFETEQPLGGANTLWPIRWALVETGVPLPTGAVMVSPTRRGDDASPESSFGASPDSDRLLAAVRRHLTLQEQVIGVEATDGILLVHTMPTSKRIGKEVPTPVPMAWLADVATAIGQDLRASSPT